MSSFIDRQQELVVGPQEVGISWTGQAGFAFKDSLELVYHVDPYLSNICSQYIGYHRIVRSPVEAESLVADFIFFTHEHRDHLDEASVPVIAAANPEVKFVGPPACISCLLELGISSDRLITIRRGEEITLGHAVVKAVLAYHTNDSVGYLFRFGNLTLYITGDTTYSDDLIQNVDGDLDFLATCMNGRLGCMNIPDSARLTGHLQPLYAVPMHHGMFKENTANPKEFVRQVEAYSGITKGFMMEHGKWYLFSKDGFVIK